MKPDRANITHVQAAVNMQQAGCLLTMPCVRRR